MSLGRDLKQTTLNGIEDLSKLTKLVTEDMTEKVKQGIREEAIQSKVEDLKEGYQHMKDSIKDTFK